MSPCEEQKVFSKKPSSISALISNAVGSVLDVRRLRIEKSPYLQRL